MTRLPSRSPAVSICSPAAAPVAAPCSRKASPSTSGSVPLQGALYALVAPRRLRELSASAYAAMLYGASYRGYLPALGLHPRGEHDDPKRQASNVAGHVVYGLVLAEALRFTEPPEDPGPPSSA